jgi:DNA-binding transcriptional LysR family regulator
MYALRQAAEAGIGIAQLADYVVMDQIASGGLEIILPDWTLPSGIVHAVFPSRRGLSPAVRSFLDFLAAEFRA